MIPISKLVKSIENYFWKTRGDNISEGHIYAAHGDVYDIGSQAKPFRYIYARNIVGVSSVSSSSGNGASGVKITGVDTTSGFLNEKLTVSGILTKTINNAGGDEELDLTVDTSTLLLRSGANSLQGNLSVDAGITIDGIDISAHAADPDAHHEAATAGNGINVSGTQVISVGLATDPGLEFSSTNLRVKAGNGITRNSTGILVNEAANFTWTGNHIFQTDTKIAADLIFQGANRTITTENNNNLFIAPHGTGLILLPEFSQDIRTDGSITGFLGQGWQLNNDSGGKSHLDIRSIYAEELHVTAFIADIARVQVGETFLSNSMALVASEEDVAGWDGFVVPAVGNTEKIYVEDNPAITGQVFDDSGTGDWVMLRFIDRSGGGLIVANAWGQVTNYNEEVGIDGVQSYTFTTREATIAVGETAKVGSLVIGFGRSGDSFIHTSVIANDAPWQRMMTWTTNPYTPANRELLVQTGNLSGITDSELNPTGHGMYATNVFLKGKLRTGNTIVDNSGLSLTHDAVAGSSANAEDGLKFIRELDDTTHSGVFGHISTTDIHTLDLLSGSSPATQSGNHRVRIRASADGGDTASVSMTANTNMPSTGILITADAALTPTRQMTLDADLIQLLSTTTDSDIRAHHFSPTTHNTYDLGTNTRYWKDLYVTNIVADTITGETSLGGQVWQYDDGDMRIRSNAATTRTLFIENQDGSNAMGINVEGNISVGGTVDGVNVAGFFATYSSHAADNDAHHNRSHDLDSVSDHTGTLSWAKVSKTGSDLADLATRAHSSLTGSASGDDHTQYVHISSARTIVARHTFNPTTANSPFILGANAQGQLVTGLYADQLSKQVIAGSGLTGGGTLTANRTLNVGAGNGITVNTDDVAVNLAYAFVWTEQHTWNTGAAEPPFILNAINQDQTVVGLRADQLNKDVIAGSGLTGGGILTADRTLNVGAGDGITVGADSIEVNEAFAFVWTAQHAFNPGTAVPPFTLNANAQSQLVVGLRADELDKDVIAGSGLTDGGTLTSDVTLNIGAGDGITVNANSIEVNEAFAFIWTAQHTWNTGVVEPPFILNAVHQGQTVIGFRADQLNKTVTAGGGLTGGGLLTADRTLTVGAGDGITVNVSDVAVRLATNSGLTFSSSQLTLGAPGTLTVSTANAVAATSHTHEVDSTADAATNPAKILQSDASGFLTLAKLISPTLDSATYIELVPTGDVIIDPGGDQMLPGGSVRVDIGAYNRKWARLYAEELIVTHLVQREVTATLGGSITVNPTTEIIADMTDVQTAIDVKHNILANGMFIKLSTLTASGVAQTEVMKVTSGATAITGGYRYSVSRAQAPYSAKAWATGDAVISLGTAVGDGWLELVSESTLLGQDGPSMTVYSRTGTSFWQNAAPVVTMGNLSSFVDYGSDEFGIALGNDLRLTPTTGFSGMTADSTDGIRLFNTATEWYESGTLSMRLEYPEGLEFSGSSVDQDVMGIHWYLDSLGTTEYAEVTTQILGDNVMLNLRSNTVGHAVDKQSSIYLSTRVDPAFTSPPEIELSADADTSNFNRASLRVAVDSGVPVIEMAGTGHADNIRITTNGKFAIGEAGGYAFPWGDVFRVVGLSLFDGNVGIGTTTPNAPLQFSQGVGNRKIVLDEYSDNDHEFYGFGIGSEILRYQVSRNISSHVFYSGNGSSSSVELMRIQGDGKVGIGHDTPDYKLQVAKESSGSGFMAAFGSYIAAGEWTGILVSRLDQEKAGIAFDNQGVGNYRGNLYFLNNGAADNSKATLSDARMTITWQGKVGIGTDLPNDTLDVAGSTNIGGIFRIQGGGLPRLVLENSYGDGTWVISPRSNDSYNLYISPNVGSLTGTNIANAAIMTLEQGGDVGIGTTNPTQKLHVNGNILANRIPTMMMRQGGNASDWSTQGTTNYTPGQVRIQTGVVRLSITTASGDIQDTVTVTFPTGFSNVPVVFTTPVNLASGTDWQGWATDADAITSTTAAISISRENAPSTNMTWDVAWLAIGPM